MGISIAELRMPARYERGIRVHCHTRKCEPLTIERTVMIRISKPLLLPLALLCFAIATPTSEALAQQKQRIVKGQRPTRNTPSNMPSTCVISPVIGCVFTNLFSPSPRILAQRAWRTFDRGEVHADAGLLIDPVPTSPRPRYALQSNLA